MSFQLVKLLSNIILIGILLEYMRQYRELNHLPNMSDGKTIKESNPADINKLESMSKEQLICEVIKARVETERTKKGYTVKGDGQEKAFISLNNLNSK